MGGKTAALVAALLPNCGYVVIAACGQVTHDCVL
jgi:hypothetical protein